MRHWHHQRSSNPSGFPRSTAAGRRIAGPERVVLSARALLKMPLKERLKFIEQPWLEAQEDYKKHPELTDFEAFGEEDLVG